ncbi:hypothetical protein BGZ60DRAFT_534212 [Tricladium varicosporioides]|nr:hypothetical protein BGZ60DRAFT_534212 [Hymenoscyphus varicosporioides]
MKIAIIVTSFAIAVASALAAALPEDVSVGILYNGAKISEMRFTGTIHGIEYSGNGTVEQIYAQFKADYPEVVAANTNFTAAGTPIHNLEARNKEQPHCCGEPGGPNWGWYSAQTWYIFDGINYLHAFRGRCDIGPGPGNCGRISCSYGSGIYLCNDNNYMISPNCGYLATYAQDLCDACNRKGYTCGQQFDTDNYNVIVHGDSC